MTLERAMAVAGLIVSVLGFAFTLGLLNARLDRIEKQFERFEQRLIDIIVDTRWLDRRVTELEKRKSRDNS